MPGLSCNGGSRGGVSPSRQGVRPYRNSAAIFRLSFGSVFRNSPIFTVHLAGDHSVFSDGLNSVGRSNAPNALARPKPHCCVERARCHVTIYPVMTRYHEIVAGTAEGYGATLHTAPRHPCKKVLRLLGEQACFQTLSPLFATTYLARDLLGEQLQDQIVARRSLQGGPWYLMQY